MNRMRAAAGDPALRAVGVLAFLVVAGFVVLALAWHGAARTPYVPLEVPWLVSGGIAGVALIGMGLGALSIQSSRREAAEHREAVEDLVRAATELIERCR
jgi:hypothetical protein